MEDRGMTEQQPKGNVPAYQIVITPAPPPGYLNVDTLTNGGVPILSCERCGSLVVLPPLHDAWHQQQAMRL
jgi:hypothetical protein